MIPLGADKTATLDREVLRGALQRAAILSNEKYRGVKLELSPGKLRIVAHNPEQEEAVEEVEADTHRVGSRRGLQRGLSARRVGGAARGQGATEPA